MRRRIATTLLLAALLPALALTGCGRKPDPEPESAAGPAPNPAPAPKPSGPGDGKTQTPSAPNGETPSAPGTPPLDSPFTFPPAFGGSQPLPPPVPGGKGTTPTVPGSPPNAGMGNPLPQVPPPGSPLPPVPAPGSPVPPDPMGKPPEPKEPTWPDAINGRPLSDYVRDANDPDPALREIALRAIPNFGPIARKEAAKVILYRMDYTKETDPGVRAAAFEAAGALVAMGKDGRGKDVGFEEEKDTKEAVRLLFVAADQSIRGGPTRLHAITTLAQFGPKAEAAIPYLTGGNVPTDPAYQTRQALAVTLGTIGFDEKTGPNTKALGCLTSTLISDPSAAVRIAAYQSIVTLGPPWVPPPTATPGAPPPQPIGPNNPPQINTKLVADYVAAIKRRLAAAPKRPGAKESVTGLVEPDRQVEVFARLALMRLDPAEVNDENMSGIAKYVTAGETGVKLQALNALQLMGAAAEPKINDVVKALNPEDLIVTAAAINTLAAMGPNAKSAIPFLETLEKDLVKRREEKWAEKRRDPEFNTALNNLKLKPEDFQKLLDNLKENMPEEQVRKLTVAAIKFIKEAKPPGAAPPPAEKKG